MKIKVLSFKINKSKDFLFENGTTGKFVIVGIGAIKPKGANRPFAQCCQNQYFAKIYQMCTKCVPLFTSNAYLLCTNLSPFPIKCGLMNSFDKIINYEES